MSFTDLPDLACDSVGGAALACNDDFFAEKDNLLRAHPAVWKEHEYTDRGKWMDGWETRRRRPGVAFGHPSHDGVEPPKLEEARDWCVVRLGMPGVIRGIVVDTAYFRGNFPESCAIHATAIDDPLDLRALETATWTQILPRSKLQGDSKNAFAIDDRHRYTHVRLDIYPDGGVARLRVHGEVVPSWSRLRGLGGPIDLAALAHGAVVETCSDMFFGSRNNLIKPGTPPNMSDGWETRRRRGPGNDWAIVRLASAGSIEQLDIDTTHFRGNAPGRCVVEGVHAPGAPAEQLTGWRLLVTSHLQPHTRHTFDGELRRIGPVTHVKLSVFPDGGVARLRAWGTLAAIDGSKGLAALAGLPDDAARARLLECCGSTAWAAQMAAHRPFEDEPALLRIGERIWWSLDETAHREAFAAHPKIGQPKPPAQAGATAGWAAHEQKSAATSLAGDESTALLLAAANRDYEAKHGFIFIVCATGRDAHSILAELRERLPRSSAEELRTAAEEQIKITRLRLRKLVTQLEQP